jgi:hypothetical protein
MGAGRTLEIPVELYDRIERVAALKDTPVAYMLERALDLVEDQPPEVVQSDAMSREEAACRAMHSELFARYAGQYVAVFKGELVDHDADELALYRRIDKRYPHDVVLMKQVEKSPEKVYHIRSLRFVRGG